MDKCTCCFLLVGLMIVSFEYIKASNGLWGALFREREPASFEYEFTGNDVIKQRHLLQTEEQTTVTVPPPPPHKDLLTRINEFYADKNNMATFCVLPIMVVIYGGCCAIYCVAKLRRHIRKKKAQREDRVQLNNAQNDTGNDNDGFENLPNGPPQPGTLSPPPPHSLSPAPWAIQSETFSRPMVPPISSAIYPAKPRERTQIDPERHEGRRDYKDLLRIKTPMPQGDEDGNEENRARIREAYRLKGPEDDGRTSVQSYKDELLARYDALSSYTMAKKAAVILRTGSNAPQTKEKQRDLGLLNGKPKQKMVFITD